MYTALVIIDVLLALALVGLILLQHGKGADAGAAFGSGSSGTVFGAAGSASLLQKTTTWLAAGFFVVTLGLSILAKERVHEAASRVQRTSVVEGVQPGEQPPSPVTQTAADSISEVEFKPPGVDSIPLEGGASAPEVPVVGEQDPGLPVPDSIPDNPVPVE